MGGRIDACFFFAGQAVLDRLSAQSGVSVVRRPNPVFVNLIPNLKRKPFDDQRVRESLSLAIDRDAFVRTVGPLSGALFHSLGLMPPGSPYSLTKDTVKAISGYDTQPGLGGNISANRRRATELLGQAGVPRGFKVTILTRSDVPAFRDGAVNVASQLKEVGLDAQVDSRDAGTFYSMEISGDFDLVVHSVAVAGTTPDEILGEGYTSFGGRNYGGWKDETLDNLYFQQSKELNQERRKVLIQEFQVNFMKTFYQINLAWVGYGASHIKALKGWAPLTNLYANMQMEAVWLER